MNLQEYLSRIGYMKDLSLSLDTLTELHSAHVFNIPFENLDVVQGLPINLASNALFDKIVTRKRGGYCFEMNGLFADVLRELGFNVRQTLARTAFGGTFSAKLHEVLVVNIGQNTYICDVGYGNDGISAPLLLELGTKQTQFVNTYRFIFDDTWGYIMQRKVADEYVPMLAMTLEECVPDDFEVASHYTSTHPMSFFKMQRFATKPTPTGRITLTDNHWKVVDNDSITEQDISPSEFENLLQTHFGLTL